MLHIPQKCNITTFEYTPNKQAAGGKRISVGRLAKSSFIVNVNVMIRFSALKCISWYKHHIVNHITQQFTIFVACVAFFGPIKFVDMDLPTGGGL